MRKLLVVGLLVLFVPASATTATTTRIAITHSSFSPAAVTVHAGDAVTWSNSDTSAHQVVSQSAGFASPVLSPGDTFTFVFGKTGSFDYTDARNHALQGQVTVDAAPGSVTLASSAAVVDYGARIELSGTISAHQPGEAVSVTALLCGRSTQAVIGASAPTSTGGAFSSTEQPTMRTEYVANWNGALSPIVRVSVRPRLQLARVAPHRFTVRVQAGSSLAGRSVTVQRWSGRWSSVRVVRLGATLNATFTLRTHAPLRIALSARQAGACYSPAVSASVAG